MEQPTSVHSFTKLADSLQRPFTLPQEAKKTPYTLPEEELIERYGMRRLTPEERNVFPGLKLVITARKVQITKAPSILPGTKGWVVWMAETYPGSFLVTFPGGGPLLAPYHEMCWIDISQDTPTTTLASAKESARQQGGGLLLSGIFAST